MSCVEKLPHSCGSSDGLQVFLNYDKKYTGYCFSCSTYVHDPYSDKPPDYKPARLAKSEEDIAAEQQEIHLYPTRAITVRRLEQHALEHFGIKTALSQTDGSTPTIAFFPYYQDRKFLAYKARFLEQKVMFGVGSLKGADLFGWQQAKAVGGFKLFITEGEFDAVALWQCLTESQKGTKYEANIPAVVSLPAGAGSASKSILGHLNDINAMFKEVVLVLDMDEQGNKAAEEIIRIIPRATRAVLPSKDANECLMEGRKKALVNACLFNSIEQKNTRIVNGKDIFALARKPAEWGLSWPWKAMTDMTRGVRWGETYYIGAGVKMGKSELVNALGKHFIIDHNLPIFMAKPEEANNLTAKMLAGKVVGKVFHDPKIEFDYDAYDQAVELIGDKLHMLDLWQHMGWSSLRQDILSAIDKGCKVIFIDPITNMINGIDSGQANTILQGIAQELAAIAHDKQVAIFIFCHLKAPDSGPPHERGGAVFSHQFSGSRAMMRSCNYMIGMEGDKNPDLPLEQRNTRKIVILEDRAFGTSGYFRVYWDEKTGLFNEMEERG